MFNMIVVPELKDAPCTFEWSITSAAEKVLSQELMFHPKILILDLDGCARITASRNILLPNEFDIDVAIANGCKSSAWDAWNSLAHTDEPNEPVLDIVRTLSKSGYFIVVLTASNGTPHTMQTVVNQMRAWGIKMGVGIMRDKTAQMEAKDFKEQFIECILNTCGGDYRKIVALDDMAENCNMFRDKGITALQTEDWSRPGSSTI